MYCVCLNCCYWHALGFKVLGEVRYYTASPSHFVAVGGRAGRREGLGERGEPRVDTLGV